MSQIKAGAFLSYVVVGLNSLVGILYTPYMLRMLGQSEYGLYSLAASVIAYLGIMDFGFGNAIIRYTAKFRAENNIKRQHSLLGMFSIIYFCIGLVTFILGLILYFNTDLIFDKTLSNVEVEQTRIMMLLLAFNLGITFCFSVFGSAITAYEDFIYMRIVQIFRIVLNTIVMIALLYYGYKAVAMVVTQTIFNFLTLFLNFVYFKYKLKLKLSFKNLEWGLLKEIGAYSFCIFIATIVDRLYWSTGPFFLGAEIGAIAVAVFSVAVSLHHIYLSFSIAVSGVFLPKVSIMAAREASNMEMSNLFIKTGRIQFIIISFFIAGFIIFGKPFIELWAGKGYDESYYVAVIFFLSYLVVGIQMLGITIIQARNQVAFRSKCIFLIGLFCIASQYFTSKHWGPTGCALSIAIAYLLGDGVIMNYYYAKKQHLAICSFWKNIGKMAVIPIFFTIIGMIIFHNFSFSDTISLSIGIIAFSILYIPSFWKFSLNQYERELILRPLAGMLSKIKH